MLYICIDLFTSTSPLPFNTYFPIPFVIFRISNFKQAMQQELHAGSAALLLRVCAHIMRGLCPLPVPISEGEVTPGWKTVVRDTAGSVHLGRVRDEHIKRAIVWCEAVIDAHFPAIALSLSASASASVSALTQTQTQTSNDANGKKSKKTKPTDAGMGSEMVVTAASKTDVPTLIRRSLISAFEVVSSADSASSELEELIGAPIERLLCLLLFCCVCCYFCCVCSIYCIYFVGHMYLPTGNIQPENNTHIVQIKYTRRIYHVYQINCKYPHRHPY